MWSLSVLPTLFAQAGGNPLDRPEILWGSIGLTAAMLVGAAIIYAVDKWRKRSAEVARDDTASLTSFRDMYEAGEITEAEYIELKRRLAEKMKQGPAAKPPEGGTGGTPANGPPVQHGERATVNPPAPPAAPTESSPPPPTA